MIGRSSTSAAITSHHELGDVALEVRGLSCGDLYRDISFEVRAARSSASTASSARAAPRSPRPCSACANPSAGQILLDGEEVRIPPRPTRSRKGISLVPEDRKGQGLVLGMNCRDNMTLPQVDDLTAGPFVAEGAEDRDLRPVPRPARHPHARLEADGRQPVGRQPAEDRHRQMAVDASQRADRGRAHPRHRRRLSKSEIHNLIRELAAQGYAVIVISSRNARGAACLRPDRRDVSAADHADEFTSDEVTEDSLIQAISGITISAAHCH
jgi:ABC-type sugar transport system ATPase subunit